MPSILSRLRTRPSSQSSRQSAQTVLSVPAATITPSTPTDIIKRAAREEPIHEASTQESALMTRKIYPDISRLPDDFAAEPMAIRHGLPPPVRRGLSGSSNLCIADVSSAPSAAKGDSDSPKASHSSSSLGNTTPNRRGFMERLGNWSTFGRSRDPPPSLNEFGEQVSPSAWRTRRTNSRRSSRMTSSMYSSPENKENTPRLSSQSSLGRRTTMAAATRTNTPRRISTSVARELGFDSPRTLGHPSPEVIVSSASQAPLPVPDHSGLNSRSRTATFPPRVWSAGTKNKRAGQFKSLRPYRSLPRVQHIFRTRSNKSVEEGNEQREGEAVVDDAEGDQGNVPVPTIASWPSGRPINGLSQLLGPPSSSTSSSSSSSSPNPSANFAPGGLLYAHDPKAHNLYDPNISLFDNVVGMPQDAPRVRDKKPLRSSLKASARPSPTPIASSSSNTGASDLMPSFSLVAAVATASDTALHQTPLSSPDRSETAKGKRKAEDVEITPPDSKKATFAVPGACTPRFFSFSTIAWITSGHARYADCFVPNYSLYARPHSVTRALLFPQQQTRSSLRSLTIARPAKYKCTEHRHILLPHLLPGPSAILRALGAS